MNLSCIIIDDEPIARKLLTEYIEDINFLHIVGVSENPIKAKDLLLSKKIDLMFLDINMPKMNGMDFLKTNSQLPPSIITTAYSDYAIEGFELDVLDYLVKPFSFDRFLKACLKAKDYYDLRNRVASISTNAQTVDYFFVKCNGKFEKIFFEELVYVEAMQNYIILHTSDERKLIVYLTIKSVLEQLPNDLFLKVHKSAIVNLKKIKSIDGNTINLEKVSVTISQNLHDEVLNIIVKRNLLKRN